MGRRLMRVPLDFNWPRGKVWGGYINPFSSQSIKCVDCDGTGSAPDAKRFHDEWYGNAPFDAKAYGSTPLTLGSPVLQAFARRQIERTPEFYGTGETAVQREARRLFDLWRGQWCHQLAQVDVDALVAGERLWNFTRVARTPEQKEIVRAKAASGENSWLPESNGYTPTAAEVNDWSIAGFGHDSINSWVCVTARCVREGVPSTCSRCNGEGSLWPSAAIEKQCEEWTREEPPMGEGYQLWETTSEGSPNSPVFATLDALCVWCGKFATVSGNATANAAKWREMLDDGLVAHREGNALFL